MKTAILAAVAALSLGAGYAYAGDGDAPHANTSSTEIPGVIARAPEQLQPGSTFAGSQPAQPVTNTFFSQHSGQISVFTNHNEGGANN